MVERLSGEISSSEKHNVYLWKDSITDFTSIFISPGCSES